MRPERCAIPPSLHLDVVKIFDFFVSGQTCGQTKNLRNFQHSGEPKKSVFSMVFSSFRKIYAENGDGDPNATRYQLRYASIFQFLSIFVSGQTCGQTEDLMIFRHSGEPKKSVFSRVFGSSRKFCAERGDCVPNQARYHLRYTPKSVIKL